MQDVSSSFYCPASVSSRGIGRWGRKTQLPAHSYSDLQTLHAQNLQRPRKQGCTCHGEVRQRAPRAAASPSGGLCRAPGSSAREGSAGQRVSPDLSHLTPATDTARGWCWPLLRGTRKQTWREAAAALRHSGSGRTPSTPAQAPLRSPPSVRDTRRLAPLARCRRPQEFQAARGSGPGPCKRGGRAPHEPSPPVPRRHSQWVRHQAGSSRVSCSQSGAAVHLQQWSPGPCSPHGLLPGAP